MNGFQFTLAISAAAAAASTCCSPVRNKSSPPRQMSTQGCHLRPQSMSTNIEIQRCYSSRRLLSISIPAYRAGNRRPLFPTPNPSEATSQLIRGCHWLKARSIKTLRKPIGWCSGGGQPVSDSSVTAAVSRELKSV